MQSKDSSKKPKKSAEATAEVAEPTQSAEVKAKARVRKPSSSKKAEIVEKPISATHQHKLNTTPMVETAVASGSSSISAGTSVSHERIAELAHSYWVERGYKHGYHQEDWLRAEQQLARARSAKG